MKVNVYDLSHIMHQKTGVDFNGLSEKNAIIIGEDRYIMVDADGVHAVHRKDCPFKLTSPIDGKEVEISFEDITVRGVPVDEVELGTFVRSFGRRIEANYRLLLSSIKQIGLNPDDFPRNVP